MDAIEEFPSTSSFFKAADLQGKRLTLTIAGARKQVMKDGVPKLVIGFDEDPRDLILNVGNRTELVARFGRDTGDWIGRTVTLYAARVQGPNGMTFGVRFTDADAGAAEDSCPF
jgi:hypothetical protein